MVLTELPLVSPPLAENLTGTSRADVLRNLNSMEARALVREAAAHGHTECGGSIELHRPCRIIRLQLRRFAGRDEVHAGVFSPIALIYRQNPPI